MFFNGKLLHSKLFQSSVVNIRIQLIEMVQLLV